LDTNQDVSGTGQSDEDFLVWLRETLIPDLHENGQENLVEDFERLIRIVEDRNRTIDMVVKRINKLVTNLQENS
jgi:hypothetical protein